MRQALRRWRLLVGGPGTASAQSVESDVTPESAHLVKDDHDFAMSSIIPDETLEAAKIEDEHDRFSVKFGFVVMPMDYTSFDQDARSKQQVGNQQDELEARSLRLSARGHFELFRTWNYMLSYEYKGFDQTSVDDWNTTDVRISTVLGPRLGTLTLGKIKEPFVYEMVGDAANLPHNERLLSPFFRSRNDGVTLGNAVLDQRATWAVGWYNDWWTQGTSWSDSGNDFAGPRHRRCRSGPRDGANYLHLAASTRYYGAVDDQLRYKGKPASNVADDLSTPARSRAIMPGTRASRRCGTTAATPCWPSTCARTSAPATSSDPTLDGWYVTGSWVITGEHRPYDRKAGYARRILPQGRWGAVELIGRYGHVDLDDRPRAAAARMDGWWAGVNWWANNRWKASVGYGNIDLDRFGIDGNTQDPADAPAMDLLTH